MAQQYTKILRTIWLDAEFLALPFDSKMAYIMVITQPDISACGVVALRLNRWATLFPDRTAKQLAKALEPLVERNFLIVDHETEEVMARTFIRHDASWRQTNGMASIENGKRGVLSQQLRQLIDDVVANLDPKSKPPVDPTPRPTVPSTVPSTVEPTVPTRTFLETPNSKLETEPRSSSSTAADVSRLAQALDNIGQMDDDDEDSFTQRKWDIGRAYHNLKLRSAKPGWTPADELAWRKANINLVLEHPDIDWIARLDPRWDVDQLAKHIKGNTTASLRKLAITA